MGKENPSEWGKDVHDCELFFWGDMYHCTMTITLYFELILRHSLVSESKLQCYKIGIGGHYVPKSPWEETIFKNNFHSAHRVTTTTRVTVAKVSMCKL